MDQIAFISTNDCIFHVEIGCLLLLCGSTVDCFIMHWFMLCQILLSSLPKLLTRGSVNNHVVQFSMLRMQRTLNRNYEQFHDVRGGGRLKLHNVNNKLWTIKKKFRIIFYHSLYLCSLSSYLSSKSVVPLRLRPSSTNVLLESLKKMYLQQQQNLKKKHTANFNVWIYIINSFTCCDFIFK